MSGAGAVITDNTKDFPADRVPAAVEVLSPAAFVMTTVSSDPAQALRAVEAIAARSGRTGPLRSAGDVLGLLAAQYGMDDAVELLREVLHGG